MRRLGAVVLALAVVVGAALHFAPRLLDEAALRDRLGAIASARLGRPVALNGAIVLRLLPQPLLEATAVEVGDPAGGVGATARSLRLTLGAGALARGRLEPRELVLVGAVLRLPWPLALQELRPPAWLTAFEARLEDSQVRVGSMEFEGVALRLSSQGAATPLLAEGRLAWSGRPVRFDAKLGRAGFDGAAPFELRLASAGAQAAATGILDAEGGFGGDLAVVGSDLAVFLPAPPGPFELRGRLNADAELIALDPLDWRLDGQAARGAASLRLGPSARLDLALNAATLDLDPWRAAWRARPRPPLPISLDLAIEAARLGGLPFRQLRGGLRFEADRFTLIDASAVLPGETRIEAAGASAGARLELGLEVTSRDPRRLLPTLGAAAPIDPARFRAASGRLRLAVEGDDVTVTDLDARIDGTRVTGGGAWRGGPRPVLGLGLGLDRVVLDGLWPDRLDPFAGWSGGPDLNLRLTADQAVLRGIVLERIALDAGREGGRLTIRRLGLRVDEADLVAAAVIENGDALVVTEATVEASGRLGGRLLAGALPESWRPLLGRGEPLLLRATMAGPRAALGFALETELGSLRIDANGVFQPATDRVVGTLSLRHPGVPRLLAPLTDGVPPAWLGEGSLALTASIGADPRGLIADPLTIVAGDLRAQGRLALETGDGLPRVRGQIRAERLPLPGLPDRAARMSLQALRSFEAEVAVEAERVTMSGAPTLEAATATLRLGPNGLELSRLQARLAGGALGGDLTVAEGPEGLVAKLRATLADATLAAPLTGWPLDLVAGRVGGEVALAATGHSRAGWLATLRGTAALSARDGVLAGANLPAALAATAGAALPAVEAELRAALAGGATGFDQLRMTAEIGAGQARGAGVLTTADGLATAIDATLDAGRDTIDVRLALSPSPGAPTVGLRVAGSRAGPRRTPELAPYLRWRAEGRGEAG